MIIGNDIGGKASFNSGGETPTSITDIYEGIKEIVFL
jgi:hypothetical protein